MPSFFSIVGSTSTESTLTSKLKYYMPPCAAYFKLVPCHWSSAIITLTILSCALSIFYTRLFAPTSTLGTGFNRLPHKFGYMSVSLPKQGQTTKSYWLQDGANPLAREGADASFTDENVDVVVIGSGITGVSAVYHLVQGMKGENVHHDKVNLKVVLLEARDFCSGATGRNGGHFITLPYDGFRSRSARPSEGKDEGVLATELEMRTIKELSSLIKTNGWENDVHLTENGHTRLFFTEEEEEADLVEYTAAKNAKIPWQGIDRLTKAEMIEKYGIAYSGVSISAGSLWPVKLATKLFQLAVSEARATSVSLHLHTHTPAEAVEPIQTNTSQSLGTARWAVRTPRGILRTRFIIHATNAWAAHLLPQFAMPEQPSDLATTVMDKQSSPSCAKWIAPYRGQIIATRANVPPSKLPRGAFAADWMEDYWLPKPIHGASDDSENALVILGGGTDSDEDATELGVSDDTTLNPRLSESLRSVLPKVFPQFFDKDTEPEMEWTGIMAFTDIEDPIVGPVPDPAAGEGKYLPGQFIAAGYTGHGMSRAYSCAEAVVQMVFEEMRTKEGQSCLIRPSWLPASFTTLRTARHES